MAANIDAEIRDIQEASRGEQVRDAIVNALVAINDSDGSATQELVNQLIDEKVGTLDAASTGGTGKYIKSISETNGVIAASEETADTSPTKNSQKLITSDGVATAIEELQTNFQDGVDDVYDAVVAKGSTPASKSLSDVIEGINNIQGGSHHIIKHTDTWEANYNIGPMFFNGSMYLWDDGDDLYYSRDAIQTVFDQNTLTFNKKDWNINVNVQGIAVAKIDDYIVFMNGNTWYLYDKENSAFEQLIGVNGENVWTDGTNIYYSNGATQKVFDKATRTWSNKAWNGLTSFSSFYIWSDGTDIYYSSGSTHKVLDKSTSTWNDKTWNGFNSFNGNDIWTDGDNVYYSQSSPSVNYVLDKSLGVWYNKTWNGLTGFYGSRVWTDGTDIYYSYGNAQKVLDKSTSTWSDKTWNGLTEFDSSYIWSDGTYIYYSGGSTQKVLDKSTSTWNNITWVGFNSFYGSRVWTDGTEYYYSVSENAFLHIDTAHLKLGEIVFSSNNAGYIWSDGTNVYYSYGATQKIFDKTLKVWYSKTWNGLTSFDGSLIWTDGTDYYYSYGTTQKVLDKSTSTWSDKTWSGVTSFSGNSIKNVNGNTYLQTGTDSCYILDKATSAWSRIYNWIPAPVTNVFYINGVYYTYNNDLYYIYNSASNTWNSVNIWGPCSLTAADIWYDEGNTYYSYGSKQYVLDTSNNKWKKKVWRGVTNITGRYIWTDGVDVYYSNGASQYKLDKSTSLWFSYAWKGAITNLVKANIWNDRKAIYHTDGVTSYKLGVIDEGGSDVPGIVPSGEVDITENGRVDVTHYEYANINVPGIVPSGIVNITENGTTDVSNYQYANVNIPSVTPSGVINITENGTVDVSSYQYANVNISSPAQEEDLESVIRRGYESTSVAVKSHAANDLFFYSNDLCKAKTSIAIGDTLVENTNYEVTTVVDVMNGPVTPTTPFTTTSVKDITKMNSIPNTGVWVEKTWNGLPSFDSDGIWTDGDNIYYSSGRTQKVLDKSTSTWSDKTWNGFTDFGGNNIWTDGTDIYCSTQEEIEGKDTERTYVLDKAKSTWSLKQWNWSPADLADYYGWGIQNTIDINNTIYDIIDDEYKNMVLDKSTSTWSKITYPFADSAPGSMIDSNYIWTDGNNYYVSSYSYQKLINKETLAVSDIQWNGISNLSGYSIWSDGINVYYSRGTTQKVLDKSTSTWSDKTWSGITYNGNVAFDASHIWSDGTHIYYSESYGNRQYVLT